jgi:AhpC/TSA family
MLQEIGHPVPPFSLPLLTEDMRLPAASQDTRLPAASVSLESVLHNHRGALIVFWSGVCSHCHRYDEYFNSFSTLHPDLGFVAIGSRLNESRAVMQSSVRDRRLTFPIVVDEGGKVARQYFAQQTPRCYLVGPDRILHYRGAIDNFKMPADPEYLPWLEPAIASFLAGQPIARPETASFGCAIETVYFQIPGQL